MAGERDDEMKDAAESEQSESLAVIPAVAAAPIARDDDEVDEDEEVVDDDDDDEDDDEVLLGFVRRPEHDWSLLRHRFPSKAGGVPVSTGIANELKGCSVSPHHAMINPRAMRMKHHLLPCVTAGCKCGVRECMRVL